MSFPIDTDICSAHLKNVRIVTSRFLQYTGRLHLSAITLGELYTWALRAKASPRRLLSLVELLNDVTVLPVEDDVARRFGEVNANLLDAGRTSPGLDFMIAGTALVHGLILVTHNTRDYADIPGLTVVDWLAPWEFEVVWIEAVRADRPETFEGSVNFVPGIERPVRPLPATF